MIDLTALDQRIRDVVHAEARPLYVSQRTCAAVLGLDAETYLRLARRGAWPATKVRRLVTSRTADVAAYLDERIAHAPRHVVRPDRPSRRSIERSRASVRGGCQPEYRVDLSRVADSCSRARPARGRRRCRPRGGSHRGDDGMSAARAP